MITEASGVAVSTTFDQESLKLAITKKIISWEELNLDEIIRSITKDLINEGFLKTEVVFALMDLERDGLVISDMKRVSDSVIKRHFKINSSTQTINEEEEE